MMFNYLYDTEGCLTCDVHFRSENHNLAQVFIFDFMRFYFLILTNLTKFRLKKKESLKALLKLQV